MAIKIPTIQRMEPGQYQSIGRVNAQISAEPQMREVEAIANAANKLGQAGVNYAEAQIKAKAEFQQDARKITVKKLGTNYDSEIDNIRVQFDALPLGSDLSARYNEDLQKRDKIKADFLSAENLDEQTKSDLDTYLTERDAIFDERMKTKYAKSVQAYEIKTSESEFKMFQKDALVLASKIDPKNPNSFLILDEKLEKVGSNITDYAQVAGIAQKDESGQPIYSEVTKSQVSKAKGDTVKIMVDNLLAIGQVEKAKAIYDRYKDDLLPDDKFTKLNETFAKAEKEQKIKSSVNKFKNLREDVAIEAISKTVPSELVEETVDRLKKEKIKQREDKNRKSSEVEVMLKNLIDEKNKTGNPYLTVEEFENDPRASNVLKSLTPEDRQSVRNQLGVRNKVGDAQKYDKLLESYQSGEMDDWTYEQLRKEAVSLNTSQWTNIEKKFNKIKGGGEKGIQVKDRRFMSPRIKQSLAGVVLQANADTLALTTAGKAKWRDEVEPFIEAEMDKLPKEFSNSTERNEALKQITVAAKLKFSAPKKEKQPNFFQRLYGKAKSTLSATNAEPAVEQKKTSTSTSLTIDEQKKKILKEKYNQ